MKSIAIIATVTTLASAQLAHVPSRKRTTGSNAIQSEWGRQHQDKEDVRSVRKVVRERLLQESMSMSVAVEVSSMSMAAEDLGMESLDSFVSNTAVEDAPESTEVEGAEEVQVEAGAGAEADPAADADAEVVTRGASSAGVMSVSALASVAMAVVGAAALF
ncbi:hypothetical protein ACHAXS_009425 [Conticribra weissflogii]